MTIRQQLVAATTILAIAVPAWVPASTIAYWRFEDGQFLADSTGNGHTLTAVGTIGPITLPNSGPGSAFPKIIPQTGAVNEQAADNFNRPGQFNTPYATSLVPDDFTIEAFVRVPTNRPITSTNSPNGQMIVSHWIGSTNNRSWGFGVANTTGNFIGTASLSSQELAFALTTNGQSATLVRFGSGMQLQTNSEYYVALSYLRPSGGDPGAVTFWLQNLTAGGPLLSSTIATNSALFQPASGANFEIGVLNNDTNLRWDGFFDEVRFSQGVLPQDQLLMVAAAVPEPASLLSAAIGVACVGLCLRRRRRRKS